MTPIAERVEFHSAAMADGNDAMKQVAAIEVPPQGSALLKPGRTHLMLVGLKNPLKLNDTFPLHLVFAGAGPADVMVTIKRVPPWEHDDAKHRHVLDID